MRYFIPYVLLGAVFAGILDKGIVKDCKDHIPLEKIILVSATYPILIIVSMITDSTNEGVCEDMFND